MIVPMLKYSFLVYHAEYPAFLQHIKNLGVLHIEQKNFEPTPEIVGLYRTNTELMRAIKLLNARKSEPQPDSAIFDFSDAQTLLTRFREIEIELENCNQQLTQIAKEEKIAAPWGNFSFDLVKKLEQDDVHLRFLVCLVRKYKHEWEKEHCLEVVTDIGGHRYFVKIEKGEKSNEPLLWAGVDEIKLPSKPLAQLVEDSITLKENIKALEDELMLISSRGTNLLSDFAQEIGSKIADAEALHQTTHEADGAVCLVEGWVPGPISNTLDEEMEKTGVYYLKAKCEANDNPPVLLKNNRFTRLFEMISKLYSLPNYRELDLTPFLAPFYLLFFGFCFSDAGYGLLLIAVATWIKFKKYTSSPVLSLIQLLGASTVFFGLLGGTFFGIELYKTNLPFYSNIAQMYGTVENPIGNVIQDIMFMAALGLGVIQILFGMFLRAYKITKRSGFKHAISTLSWAFLIIFSLLNYYLTSIEIVEFVNTPWLIAAVTCGIGIFFLNTPGKNLLLNFGAGLWDAYNTVVGGVGDVLSYARLFALGLASAILGLVFNDLALTFVNPDASIVMQGVGIVLMLLVLIAGHAINIFMSGLGSLVHPLRLTFVEFYKNAGFEGGGKPYNPFVNKYSNKQL